MIRQRPLSYANDQSRPDPSTADLDFAHYPSSYTANMGEWFIYDPLSKRTGTGLVFPNSKIGFRDVLDGTSNTLAVAEVKAFNPYLRDGLTPAAVGVPTPPLPETVVAYGGNFKTNSGHTEWVDSRIHQSGFTTTFGPNTKLLYTSGGAEYDVDFNSSREGKTITDPTYAAVTSRSYHTGGVQTSLVDGSVRFYTESIDRAVWRDLGTRAGHEAIPSDQ